MTPYTIHRRVDKAVAGTNIRVMLFSAPESQGSSKCLFFEGNGKRVCIVVKRGDSPAKLSKRAKHAVAVIEKSGGVFPVETWHFAEQNKGVTKTAILTEEE